MILRRSASREGEAGLYKAGDKRHFKKGTLFECQRYLARKC